MRHPRNYIIRIYRQGARSLTGVVEDVRTGQQRSFSSMQDLWTLLRKAVPKPTHGTGPDKPG